MWNDKPDANNIIIIIIVVGQDRPCLKTEYHVLLFHMLPAGQYTQRQSCTTVSHYTTLINATSLVETIGTRAKLQF